MKWPQARYRSRLDGFGEWRTWELSSAQTEELQQLVRRSAHTKLQELRRGYGTAAEIFGAATIAREFLKGEVANEASFRFAMAVVSLDYFAIQCAPPRPRVGGMTNPANRRTARRLYAYLLLRLLAASRNRIAASLQCQAMARMPENWLPVKAWRSRLEASLSTLEPFESISVAFSVKPPAPGGGTWLAERLDGELQTLQAELDAQRPVLLEIVKIDSPRLWSEALIAVALRDEPLNGCSILCASPFRNEPDRVLTVRKDSSRPQLLLSEVGKTLEPVHALVCYRVNPSTPPLFGFRRWTRMLFPWRMLWRLRHWITERGYLLHLSRAGEAGQRTFRKEDA